MFCSKCGNKLEEGTAFCPKCGTQVGNGKIEMEEERSMPVQQQSEKKKPGYLKYIFIVIGLFLVIGVSSLVFGRKGASGNTELENKYITLVQTGYLGEYTDATVKDILEAFQMDDFTLEWTCGEMDGEMFVGFHSYLTEDGDKNSMFSENVLFKICSDDTFKVTGLARGGEEEQEATVIADYLNSQYMNWYILNKIGEDATEEEQMEKMQELIYNQFDKISGSAVLYGASKDYTGDRGQLGVLIDNQELLSLSVTELINQYSDNMLDVYTTFPDTGIMGEQETAEQDGMIEAPEFNLERVENSEYINGTADNYRFEFFYQWNNDVLTYSLYYDGEYGYDIITNAEAVIVDDKTLHLEDGFGNWAIDLTWFEEGAFIVSGDGGDMIPEIIGTTFYDTSVYEF